MIPKVDKFEFYCSTDSSLLQLIGNSTENCDTRLVNKENKEKMQQAKYFFFDLVNFEFRVDNYGLPNWFIEKSFEECNINNIIKFLKLFNLNTTVDYINQFYTFYDENKEDFTYLSTYPDDFSEKLDELDEKIKNKKINLISSLIDSIEFIGKEIRNNPSKYCRDENGEILDPNYTGFLNQETKGKICKEYNFLDGRMHGLCLDYDFFREKREKLSFFYRGKLVEILKRWDSEGNLSFEKLHDREKRWIDGVLHEKKLIEQK